MINLEFANDVIHLHYMEWQENSPLYHLIERQRIFDHGAEINKFLNSDFNEFKLFDHG